MYARQCVLQEPFDLTPGQKEIRNQIKILELQSAPRFSIRFEDRIHATLQKPLIKRMEVLILICKLKNP